MEQQDKDATTKIKELLKRITALQKKKGGNKDKANKAKKDQKFKKNRGWKFQAPRPGDEINGEFIAEHNGKRFHWCSLATGARPGTGCNMWTVHRPEDCKGLWPPTKKTGQPKNKSNKSKAERALAAKTAKMSIDDGSSSDGYATE